MKRYQYTVADFTSKAAAQDSLLRLLEPLRPFYSEGGARINLTLTSTHYENDSISMESWARQLWGLVPYWAGGGRTGWAETLFPRGLAAGTDPENPEYWHTCRDYDQKFCEMAAISYGLLFAPDILWEPLSEREKENVTEWLWEINRHECCACNWQWFAVLTNLALKVRGRRYSAERIESGLAMMEDYYDKGGWYNDGNGGEKDYYNPFVMVPYGLMYAEFQSEEEPERCARYRERAKAFALDYLYWFADDGASIAYGRSMTYRFAQGAFWAISLLCGEDVLPLSVMKGLLARHLAWWLNQPMYDNAGVLSIGYSYPNLQMSESYNAPGSPYWALKAFAFLALPDDHPFWKADAAPLPDLEPRRLLENAGMVLQHGKGNAVALLPGHKETDAHGHTAEKYGKFAYSSRWGFSVERSARSLEQAAPDSMLAFEVGGLIYTKDLTEPGCTVSAFGLDYTWSPLAGITVHTRIEPTAAGHIRTHTIESAFDCTAYDCGFALPAEGSTQQASGALANVWEQGGFCALRSLAGDGRGEILIPHPNTNLICSKTAIPMVVYQISRGESVLRTEVSYLEG